MKTHSHISTYCSSLLLHGSSVSNKNLVRKPSMFHKDYYFAVFLKPKYFGYWKMIMSNAKK
jgi:hypothetical protein